MSNVKALEKLREKIERDVNNPWEDLKGALLAMADKVEAEIAERFIELPVDAESVPIRIGDTVREVDDRVPMKVMSLTFYEDCVDVNTCGMNPNLLRHVKPRTLEKVLCDMIREYGSTDMLTEAVAEKYAAEIRGLLGVVA